MTKKFDPTKPVQTRDGRAARIICTDRKTKDDSSIVALVTVTPDITESETTLIFTTDGCISVDGIEHPIDLINVPEKHTVWVNMYPVSRSINFYKTRKEADINATCNRTACVEVTYTEGEGLN